MEKKVVVRNPHGLHARPAAKFVQAAASVPEDVTVEKDGKSANAKSILSVLSLGVSKGDTVTLTVGGESVETLLQTLEEILVSEAE